MMLQYLLLNPLFKPVTMMLQSQNLMMVVVMVAVILMERWAVILMERAVILMERWTMMM
jgi:hypothetical protein